MHMPVQFQVTTVGEELQYNPRLAKDEVIYIAINDKE